MKLLGLEVFVPVGLGGGHGSQATAASAKTLRVGGEERGGVNVGIDGANQRGVGLDFAEHGLEARYNVGRHEVWLDREDGTRNLTARAWVVLPREAS